MCAKDISVGGGSHNANPTAAELKKVNEMLAGDELSPANRKMLENVAKKLQERLSGEQKNNSMTGLEVEKKHHHHFKFRDE